MEEGDDAASSPGLARSTWIAAVLASTAFVLGIVGYLEAGGVSIATAVYDTLGLFTLSFASPPGVHGRSLPVVLELARFLAPAVTVLAAATIAARIFRDHFDRVTARRTRGHVVVCGLGRVGSITVARLRAAGHRVVAIERDAYSPYIRAARALRVPVVLGDARSRRTLERAGVARATRLVWSASGWVEGQSVVDSLVDTLRDNLAGARRRGRAQERWEAAPACLVRVRDLTLCTSLRRQVLAQGRHDAGTAPDLDFFNEAENVAQRLLWKVTRGYAAVGDDAIDLWVLGSGALAEALIVQATRNWWGMPQARRRPALAVHVFCEDAADLVARVEASWPETTGACRVEAHAGPAEVATSRDPAARRAAEPHAVFVLVEPQERAVQLGLRLIEETSVPHVVVAGDPRFEPRIGTSRLLMFDPVAYGLETDVLLFDTYELLARMVHEHYTLRGRVRSDGSLEPVSDPFDAGHEWSALDPFWRASNRDAARFVVPNLQAAGLGIERLAPCADSAEPMTLDASRIGEMAEREHERWRRFMVGHGWRYGRQRDAAERTNPNLVPWADADAAARTYTCTAVSEYPRLLAQLGSQIRR